MHLPRLALALLLGPLLLTLAAAPSAEAALNGARPYEATYGYLPGLGGAQFRMASGTLDVVIPDGDGTWGFFATGGAEVAGLTRVCWTDLVRRCADSSGGDLAVRVLPGGSFGLHFPTGADARVEAGHGLAIFVDLSATGDLNSLEMGKSLMAPLVDGVVSFSSLPPIASTTITDPTSRDGGAVSATEDATVIEVHEGSTRHASLRGKVDPVTFAGRPSVTPIATELAVLPFEGAGSVARFRTAERAEAAIGLDIGRINRLMERLYGANQGAPTEASDLDESAFGPYAGVSEALFAGAVLNLPTDSAAPGIDLAFARTPRLEVRGTPVGLAWSGTATLDVRDGHVAGAQPLHGIGFLALPWWGWILWIAALTVWIVRLVRKPDKTHPTWDRYKWIGWAAAVVSFVLVFVLWDFEVRAVLGLSLFSGHARGQVLALVAVLQLATLSLLAFAAIAPLRILLRNGSLLLHQGTFMGLAGAVAGILGYLIGAWTMLRAGLDLIFSQLLAALT